MNPFARMANYEELNIIGTGKYAEWYNFRMNSIIFNIFIWCRCIRNGL